MFERVDWSKRGEYMHRKHGITAAMADEAVGDANRILIDPDYNSRSGDSVRIIGYSDLADSIITVIVLHSAGVDFGVNGWASNAKDRRIYMTGSQEIEGGLSHEGEEY